MANNRNKIKSFTDLQVWQESHRLVLTIYKVTKNFPREKTFGLIGQMRRAVVSVSSNIAEGFSRRGFKEKIQFYHTALSSLTELQNQLLIAKNIGYLKEKDLKEITEQVTTTHKLLNAFITKTKSFVSKF